MATLGANYTTIYVAIQDNKHDTLAVLGSLWNTEQSPRFYILLSL